MTNHLLAFATFLLRRGIRNCWQHLNLTIQFYYPLFFSFPSCSLTLENVNAMRLLHNKARNTAYFTQHILGDGGEGVILRKPRSVYESGRSSNLLKLKVRIYIAYICNFGIEINQNKAARADMEVLVLKRVGNKLKMQLYVCSLTVLLFLIAHPSQTKWTDFLDEWGARGVGEDQGGIRECDRRR